MSPAESRYFPLDIVSLSVKLPGFEWSEEIAFPIEEKTKSIKIRQPDSEKYSTFMIDRLRFADLKNLIIRNVGRTYIAFYTKYWIINNSGLSLEFGAGDKKKKKNSSVSAKGEQSTWYEEEPNLKYYGDEGPQNIFYHDSDSVFISIPDSQNSQVFFIFIQH